MTRLLPDMGRRLLLALPVLFGVSVISFMLIHLAPGDPATYLAGDSASADFLARTRHRFELDRPLPRQYLIYVTRLVQGDMGRSFTQGVSVAALTRGPLGAPRPLVLASGPRYRSCP